MESWFHPDDVSKNAQKRRDIQRLILNTVEKCNMLPPGIELPVINFVSLPGARPNYSHPHNNSQFPNQNFQNYNPNIESSEDDVEAFDDDEEDDDIEEEENYELDDDGQYEDQYPSGNFLDYSDMDQSEYLPEVGGNDQWSNRQQHIDYSLE